MKSFHRVTALGLAAAFATTLAFAGPAAAKDVKLNVVGTWGNLELWKQFESRLWNDDIPKATNNTVTANAKPYTELGIKGFEVMRLLKIGAYDAVHGLTTYTSQDSPPLEGIDLAGVIQDMDTYRKAINAYRDIIERELDQKYNAKLLMLYTFPSQQLWCKISDGKYHLKDLKGKKIRAYSTAQGDFIEGLGASAVTLSFAEVVPALQRGVADCGVTGTMPAYNAKWWQVVTHNIRARLGYAATFLAFNKKSWAKLSKEQQQEIEKTTKSVEDEMWKFAGSQDQQGMDCNAAGPCPYGKPGGMTPVDLNDDDKKIVDHVVKDVVLTRFAKRCGAKCAKEWNSTIGEVVGHKAPE